MKKGICIALYIIVVCALFAQESVGMAQNKSAESWAHKAIAAYTAGDFALAQEYFANAAPTASKDLLQTIALYQAEMAVQAEGNEPLHDKAVHALRILADSAAQTKLQSSDALFAQFRVAQARAAGLAQDWEQCERWADAVLNVRGRIDSAVTQAAVYWKALSQYQTEKYAKACKTIEPHIASADVNLQVLYAKSLAQADRMADALTVFAAVAEKNVLPADAQLDYARTLLYVGQFAAAGEQAAQADGAEAAYLQGLAAFNERKWDIVAPLMNKAIAARPALEAPYVAYAQFYSGYAQYRTEQYTEALASLSEFAKKNPRHGLRFVALVTAAHAAVQINQYAVAADSAEQAIYAAHTDEEQHEAVLLTAGIYADAEDYSKAEAVLTPYQGGKNQFAYQCRYELARIQVLQQNFSAADSTYAALASEKNGGAYAEEAAYRRGELQYAQGNYAQAATLFEAYTQKWNGGQFADAALYFAADSLAKSGQTDRAILYFMQVDNLRTQSTYKYNAEKNLAELYRAQGDYANALVYARKLLTNYGDQAREDGILKTIDELEQLSKGENTTVLSKEKDYERAGKDSTPNGRAIGTELAQLYAARSDTRAKGISLAEALLPKQTAAAESAYAKQNALLLAQHYRANGDAKRAAQTYLSAAQYARAAGSDDEAARSLYGAVEAFDAAGQTGDAQAAANSLASLYPASSFVQAAQKIVQK